MAGLRILYHMFFKKRNSSCCLFLFFAVIGSQGEYKAAKKEQELGKKSVETKERLLVLYSVRCMELPGYRLPGGAGWGKLAQEQCRWWSKLVAQPLIPGKPV